MENEVKRILIADDNEVNIKILNKILTKAGYVAEPATDGTEAVDMFDARGRGYYSLIITDVRMPGISGIEEAQRIRNMDREDAKSIPILAYTANLNDEEREAAQRAGISECVLKPLTPGELLDRIEKHLGKS